MEDKYIPIDELRKVTQDVFKRKEEEQRKLQQEREKWRQKHMLDLFHDMQECINEHMATSAAKGYYDVTINMEVALKTPCDTDEERQMRLKVLSGTATALRSRGFKVRFNNLLHISISWEE